MKRTLEQNAASYFRYSGVMSNAHYDMAEIYRLRHRRFGILVVSDPPMPQEWSNAVLKPVRTHAVESKI